MFKQKSARSRSRAQFFSISESASATGSAYFFKGRAPNFGIMNLTSTQLASADVFP